MFVIEIPVLTFSEWTLVDFCFELIGCFKSQFMFIRQEFGQIQIGILSIFPMWFRCGQQGERVGGLGIFFFRWVKDGKHFPVLDLFWGSECCVLFDVKQSREMLLVPLWLIYSIRWEHNLHSWECCRSDENGDLSETLDYQRLLTLMFTWQSGELSKCPISRKCLKPRCVTVQMFLVQLKLADQPSGL